MQKKLLVAALGTLFAMPVLAADAPAAPAAPYTITGNVGFISDYTFRGISQTFRSPALQGGFDFAHTNGLYLGTWASNINGSAQYTNANMEWDFYGGYNGTINDDLGYSVGLITVYYPGGKTALAAPNRKWDTTEWNIGATWKGLNLKYSQTLTDWYGINATGGGFNPQMWKATDTAAAPTGVVTANNATADSKGSGYFEANYTYTFGGDVALALHAGHQNIKNFNLLSYSDYKIGISKPFGGFTVGAAYTSTNASDNNLFDATNGVDKKNLRGGILAVSVIRSF